MSPDISIGIPVYNGENYLADAIESVLRECAGIDFEIVIADNCSSDRSLDIASEYARRCDRIRVFVNEQNVGAARNYGIVLGQARGRYFKWLAHDDVLLPGYMSAVRQVVESGHCAGVFTDAYQIDEAGTCEWTFESVAPLSPWPDRQESQVERLVSALCRDGRPAMVITMGMFNRQFLTRYPRLRTYYSSDWTFAVEAAANGSLVYLDAPLVGFRRHPQSSSYRGIPSKREQQEFFDPALAQVARWRLEFQHRRRFLDIPWVIANSRLDTAAKTRLLWRYVKALSGRSAWRLGYALRANGRRLTIFG